jgi:hypothetical protein
MSLALILALAVALFACSFAIRIPFTLIRTGDDWVSAWVLRNQRRRLFSYDFDDGLRPAFFGYPPLHFIFMLAFPEKHRTRAGILLSPAYDAILAVLLLLGVGFGAARLLPGVDDPTGLALAVALLYATSPVLTPTSTRLSGLKTRSLGCLLFFLYFTAFAVAYVGDQPGFYVVAFACGLLIILGSQMALQAWFFSSLALSLFYLDPVAFGLFVLTCAVGWFIPGLGIDKILRTRLHHMRWYARSMGATIIGDRNQPREMLRTPLYLFTDRDRFLTQLLLKNSIYIALVSNVPLLLLVWWVVGDGAVRATLWQHDMLHYCIGMTLGGLLGFAVTSLRWFLFIGEAERYLEFSLPFSCLLVVAAAGAAGAHPALLVLAVMLQLAVMFLIFYFVKRNEFRSVFSDQALVPDLRELSRYLRAAANEKGEIRTVVLPVKQSFQLSTTVADPRIKYLHMWMCGDDGFDYMREDMPDYFYPLPDPQYYRDKYRADCFILEKPHLAKVQKQFLPAMQGGEVWFQNKTYVVVGFPA